LHFRRICGTNAVFFDEEVAIAPEVNFWKARSQDVFVYNVNSHDMKAYLRSLDIPYITDDCSN